ncbi:MAG: type 4a pilus biogenesis protein PilO [Deltaproteobacteria bacterium]|nr:type 4a pilus biogenesis protein PilO [Deltaproteobacteria bacterium]
MAKLSLSSLPFEKVAAIGRLQRILICVALFLILGGSFYMFFYKPKSEELNKLRDEYEVIQTKLFTAKAVAKDLEEFEKKYEEAEMKFKLALRLLPEKQEIPSLLEGISKSGKDSGLEFQFFQPGQEVHKGFYAEIPVSVRIQGGYHNIALFFDRIAKLPRIVNVLNIAMQAPSATPGILNASCTAVTYRFLEAAPAPPQ